VAATAIAAQHVMQYAAAVKRDPTTSHVAHLMDEHRTHFLGGKADGAWVVDAAVWYATGLEPVRFDGTRLCVWGGGGGGGCEGGEAVLSLTQKATLVQFVGFFAVHSLSVLRAPARVIRRQRRFLPLQYTKRAGAQVMIWGVSVAGWEMSHMSALFVAGAACVGLTNRMSEELFTSTFLDGTVRRLPVMPMWEMSQRTAMGKSCES
jgi:hypothetical protein